MRIPFQDQGAVYYTNDLPNGTCQSSRKARVKMACRRDVRGKWLAIEPGTPKQVVTKALIKTIIFVVAGLKFYFKLKEF